MKNFKYTLIALLASLLIIGQASASTLQVQSGGTGATTLAGLLFGNGTSAIGTATSGNVISTLGYTPYNATNPSSFISNLTGFTTDSLTQGTTNKYFTNAGAIGSTLTGFTSGAGTVSSSDTILSAFQKVVGNISALVTGVSSFNSRTGAVVPVAGDYSALTETLTHKTYDTNATGNAFSINGSSVTGFTGVSGSNVVLSSSPTMTGTLNVPQIKGGVGTGSQLVLESTSGVGATDSILFKTGSQVTALTIDANQKLTLSSLANGLVKSTSGLLSNATAGTDFQAPITLTTTGSGAATFISNTLNIPTPATAAVASVFGRTGAVVATSGDYTFAQIGSKPTTLSGYGITDAYPLSGNPSGFLTSSSTLPFSSITSTPTTLSGYGITDAYTKTASDARYEVPLTFSSPLSRSVNTISIPVATTSASGYLTSTDWNTFNGKQAPITLTTTGTSGASTLTGGTLNIPNYANTTYTASTGLTLTGIAFSVNASQNITTLSNLTTAGFVKTTSGGLLSSAALTSGDVTSALGFTPGTGTVTSVATDSSLTGGAITTTGTLGLNLANANTWTGKQTFNTTAPTFGTMTAGSVFFAGTGGLLSQDNANIFYDATNHRLGIGVTTVADTFDVGATNLATNGATIISRFASEASMTNAIAFIANTTSSVVTSVGIRSTNGLSLNIGSGASANTIVVSSTNVNLPNLTASKLVFTDSSKNLTSTGIGTSSQFIKGDGSLDSSIYITANQTITLSGDVSGSGTTAITTAIGAGKVTNADLAGSIAASKLIGTDITTVGTIGTGTWQGTAIADTYIASASTWNAKQNAISLTTTGTSGAATLVGSTLNIPNYATSGIYTAGTGLTLTGSAFSVNTSQNISTLSNLTSNGLIKTSGGTGALSIATAGTDYLAPSGNGSALTGLTWSQIGSTPTTLAGYGITDAQTALTFSGGVTNSGGTVTVDTTQNISTLSNLTSNGVVMTSGGTGALSIGAAGVDFLASVNANTSLTGSGTTASALGINLAHSNTWTATQTFNARLNVNLTGSALVSTGSTTGSTQGTGLFGIGSVTSTSDTATTFGVTGQATATHASGTNIGIAGQASGGSLNYAFYGFSGDIFNAAGGRVGFGATPGTASGLLTLGGAVSSAGRGNNGAFLTINNGSGAIATDTTSSGTISIADTAGIFGTTFAASNATTYTTAATVYIGGAPVAGTNVTLSNAYALYSNTGTNFFGGGIFANGYLQSGIATGSVWNIYDGSAHIMLNLGSIASAVNNLAIYNAATTTNPIIAPLGSDTNIGININTKGTGQVVIGAPVKLKGYTVATLPTGVVGDLAYVTDALTPSFGIALVGGGAVTTTAFYNGTNWVAQ